MTATARTLTGATAVLSAAHKSRDGVLHGHTWEVTAWVDDRRDVLRLQDLLRVTLSVIEHSTLPDDLAWSEDIASFVAREMPGVVAVDVARPSERLFARWER